MKFQKLTFLLSLWILVFGMVNAVGAEAKGYKIVLASCPTFDEAKEKLRILSERLDENDYALQRQYKFEIVARPSGKAFMLAVEPIESEKDSLIVRKQFAKYYPDAYVNGYYGPTEGAVSLEQIKTQSSPESNATEADTVAISESNVSQTISEIPEKSNRAEEKTPIPKTEEANDKTMILVILSFAAAFFLIIWKIRKKISPVQVKSFREKYAEAAQEADAEDRVEMIESEAFGIVDDESQKETVNPIFEPERDIFHKFKKNIFFVTLLQELKEASDLKEDQKCRELMNEVLRYQKHFRKSVIIAQMGDFVKTHQYEALSSLINNELGS